MKRMNSNCLKEFSKTTDAYLLKLFEYSKSFGIEYYDQNFCFTLCTQNQLLSKCGCIDISTPSINNTDYCDTDDKLECMKSRICYNSYIRSICKCPQQCEPAEYD